MPRHDDSKQKEKENDLLEVELFLNKMRSFVENKSLSLDGGWAVVTKEDMKTMNELVDNMIHLRFDDDCDCDSPIDFKIIDRTRYESLTYWPLKYEHEAETIEDLINIMSVAEMNLSIATNRFQTLWKIFRFRNEEK